MERLENGVEVLGGQLKNAPKNKQGRAFIRIVQFFALMLALTLFARGAASVSMPQVTTAYPGSATIRKEEKFNGTIAAAGQEKIKIPAGLKVDKANVSPGTVVKKGDTLLTIDSNTVQKNLNTQMVALKDLQLQLAELKKNRKQDDSTLDGAQKSQKDAANALAEAHENSASSVQTAQRTLDDANALLDAAKKELKSAEKALKAAKNRNPKPEKEELAMLEAAVSEAEAKLAEAEAGLHTAQEGLATAQKQAGKDAATAQEALDSANKSLADAQQEYNENKPVFNAESQKRLLEVTQKQQEIADQEKLIADLQALAALGGVITSPLDGRVAEVSVAPDGGDTTDADHITLTTSDEGFFAEFAVEKDKVKQIKMSSLVSVQQDNSYWGSEARVVSRGAPDEAGMVTFKAQVTGNEWADGDSVSVVAPLSDKQYWNTLPLAAVRPDGDGYYVFIISEENTILGKQSIARKIPVTVQDQNNELAAVDGIYENDVRVIVSGSKPVHDGDMVRLDEESTS